MVRMAAKVLKPPRSGLSWIVMLFLLLFASLYLLSAVTQSSEQFGRLYFLLLAINVLGLVVLMVLIGANLWRLVRQYRQGLVGSRLTLRLVITFVILAVVPVSLVFYFSLGFLHRGIDSWFNVRIEEALEDALELSRTSLDARMRELLNQTQFIADELTEVSDGNAALTLNDLRSRSGLEELTLIAQSGRIIASSSTSADPTSLVPNRPNEVIISQLRQGRNYVGLDPIADAGLHVRVVVNVPTNDPTAEARMLQSLMPIAVRQSLLADSVQSAFAKYKELAYLRTPLKYSFTLTLSLALALSLLGAVWAAFFSSRQLVAPIRDLAEGTRAVAAGDYDKKLPIAANDELGFLVQSFNDMTHRIALARDDAKKSQRQAEGQRTYLETLLGRLSSGVLALDKHRTLRMANAAAGQVLGADLSKRIGDSLEQIALNYPHLHPFVETLRCHLSDKNQEWREEIILSGAAGQQILQCRGTLLPGVDGKRADHLIVFDDVTTLVQAQRNAAWGEVARRLAHEFKNPLTPIQLSAERLRHKYLKTMNAEDAEVLDRSTHTIVQQVELMKDMVNAFADYARNPPMRPRLLDLNQLINEVLDLYRAGETAGKFQVDLGPKLPYIEADPGRLRQLLHNLIKNSLEAMAGRRGARVTITSRCLVDNDSQVVTLCVQDRGGGIPAEILSRIFEPYATTKPKGTGLGLAIVKRIVEEHGGSLLAENPSDGGARVLVRLPVSLPHTGTGGIVTQLGTA